MNDKGSNGSSGDDDPLYRYRLGCVEYDEARFELRVNGLIVDLERKPLQVLTELLRHANHVVTRKQLLDSVWNGRPTVDHALANTIVKLRKALDDPNGNRIVTVPRKGYKWAGPLERVVVGRRAISRLSLKAGGIVPSRSDFELISQLGASFGNEVWLAQNITTRARRAFKFNRHGEGLGALKREATVHRLMDESLGPCANRGRLLAWNFENPPFHLEYEFGGDNLEIWAATDHRLESLPLTARLGLFLHVVDAIAAAHSVGVLHKDIKPTNVLVATSATGGWQWRVSDFGSAQLLEPERLEELGITRLGATLRDSDSGAGTPFYMAPEVLAGATSTTMSDVYSLGILLFQVIVGEMRRPLTSDWERYVSDDLLREDIALATAADPQHRLQTVAELAQRLRGRESRLKTATEAKLAAQRASVAERAMERAQARRPSLITAIASLAIGLVVSLALYQREFASRHEALRENQRAQAVNGFLGEILRSVDPTGPGGSAKMPLQEVLRRATDKLQSEFDDDPQTKATVELTLAKSFFGISQYATALPLNQQAVALRSRTLGPANPATLEAQYELARTLDMLSQHEEAHLQIDDADRLAKSQFAGTPKLALLAYSTRGSNEMLQMQAATALEDFQRADDIRERVVPNDDEWLIHIRSNIAWCDVRLGRNEEAVRALSPLMTTQYSPQTIGIAEWIKVRLQYAVALKILAQFDSAEQMLNDVRSRAVEVLGPAHYLVGLTWNYSSALYMAQGRWKPALVDAQQAYDIWHSTLTMDNQATRVAMADIAVIDYLAGPSQASLRELEAAHERSDKSAGPASPFSQYVTYYWANALVDFGRTAEADTQAGLLSEASLAAIDPAPDWAARLQGLRGRICQAQHRTGEARALLQKAVDTLSAHGAQRWVVDPLRADLRLAEADTRASHTF